MFCPDHHPDQRSTALAIAGSVLLIGRRRGVGEHQSDRLGRRPALHSPRCPALPSGQPRVPRTTLMSLLASYSGWSPPGGACSVMSLCPVFIFDVSWFSSIVLSIVLLVPTRLPYNFASSASSPDTRLFSPAGRSAPSGANPERSSSTVCAPLAYRQNGIRPTEDGNVIDRIRGQMACGRSRREWNTACCRGTVLQDRHIR